MCGLGLEDIILVRTLKYAGEPDKVSSRICPRLFTHIEMKFTSDRKDFLVEMYILLSLVPFRPFGIG